MERRRFLELALTVSVSTAATGGLMTLTGCGGGRGTFSSGGAGAGAGGSVSTRAVAGTLSLPGGFPIALTDLRVETALGGGSVGADGAFSVLVSTTETAPVLAMARSGDNALFVGFVTDGATLTIRSTAVALLYFALGGYTVPTSSKTEILGLIEAHPTVGPLTEVLTARLVADPLALNAADAQIAAALKTAVDTLLAERPLTRAAGPPAAHRATRAEGNALLLTSPTGLQSNVELLQGSAPQTIILTNHARRYCQVYLYETGNKQKGGAAATYDRAKIVTTARLNSTPAFSIGSTIFGVYSGNTAGVPVSLDPIALSMATGAEKTNFEIVVLGSSSLLSNPGIYSDPHYAAEVESWRDTRALLNVISWLVDVAFSLFLEFWGLRDVPINAQAIERAAGTLRRLQVRSWRRVSAAIEAGNGSTILQLFLELVTSDDEFFRAFVAVLAILNPSINQSLSKGVVAASGKLITKLLLAPINLVGVILGVGDIGAVLWDLAHSEPAERWSAILFTGDVTLSPASSTLAPGGNQNFTASIPALPTATNFRYKWDVTGSDLVSLADAKEGKVGKSFETSGATVNLATTPSTQGTLVLTVEAFEIGSGGERILHGKAAATVRLDPNAPPANPGEMTVKITNLLNHGIGVPTGDEYLKEYTLALNRPVDYYPEKGLGYNPQFGFQAIAFYTKYGDNNEFEAARITIPSGTDPTKSVNGAINLTLVYPTNLRGSIYIACDAQTLTTTVSGNRVDFQLSGRFYQYVSNPNRENLGYTANVEITGFFYYKTQS